MTHWTKEADKSLRKILKTRPLSRGVGNRERMCSLAAINLAATGRLTDDIRDCMSEVLGKTIPVLQDAIPDDLRNSDRYKAFLLTTPGTGRQREQERLAVLTEWMWDVVLPQLQPIADKHNFGNEWLQMCSKRTKAAARAADAAASSANVADVVDVARAAARAAANAAADVAADVAARAADAADAAPEDFWDRVDVLGMLERMVRPMGDERIR